VLGTGEGVDNDCRLDEGDDLEGLGAWEMDEFEDRKLGLGPSNFKPLDGDKAENRWELDDASALLAGVENEATDPVDGLRIPMKDIESRFDLRGRILPLPVLPVLPIGCRGSREVDVDGEQRKDWCRIDFGVVLSSSMTPNSDIGKPEGEWLADVEASPLPRQDANVETEFLRRGDCLAEAELEIRGILVGVSLRKPETVLSEELESSRLSLVKWVLTEGEPAIVGSWVRLRSDASDIFCIELAVWAVTREDIKGAREAAGVTDVALEVEDLSFATRWAVAGSKADIWIGGMATGDLGFLGSVDDNVWKKVRNRVSATR